MSSSILEQKRQSRLVLLSQAATLVTRGLNSANQATYDKLMAEISDLEDHISGLERLERLEQNGDRTYRQEQPKQVAEAVKEAVRTSIAPALITSTKAEVAEERRAKLNRAFRTLLTVKNPDRAELRDITTTDGAALVPQEFAAGAIATALKFYGPIGLYASKFAHNGGAPVKFSISDDTNSVMFLVTETGETSQTEQDPSMSSTIPGSDALVASIKYSFQAEDDIFDFENWLVKNAGIRVGRAIEQAITLGTSNQNVSGTISSIALPNSPAGGFLAGVPTGATTAHLSGGIGYLDLVALYSSVDEAYGANGVFTFSPSVRNYLLTQTTSDGRPLYSFDASTGIGTLLGKKVILNAAMPAYGVASSKAVVYGDISRAFSYSTDGLKLRVLSERYADTLERVAVIYTRFGSTALLPAAAKALVIAAS